jgi:nitrite reductase/ring-hydroxylating ferredoxin subunit
MVQDSNKSVPVGTLEELERKGSLSVTAHGYDIVVFYHEGEVHALDNRCPHMGFPLSRGSIKDGILTCDWHHARFDIKSGGCFDLWADDVPVFAVDVIDGTIFVNTERGNKRRKDEHCAYYLRRLNDAMEQNIALIIGKSVLTLDSEGVSSSDLFRKGLEYGTRYRQEGWGPGLTILTCMMNLVPYSRREDRPRALYHGFSAVAGDCSGQPPRFAVSPLPDVKSSADAVTLKRWFRHFIEVRDADGAERCLVTAIRAGTEPHILADILFSAATDHRYLDSGHVLDFTNKAFEALDIVGWDLAEQVLTSLVTLYAQATRMEERSSWRHPVDIIALLNDCFDKLPAVLEEEKGKQSRTTWKASKATIDVLLGDNPNAIVNVLVESLQDGAKEEELAALVAYAAALRIAQFPITNEYSDWDTTLHTFTFANAVQQAIRRLPSSKELLRAIFDVAMSNYLNRFLNVPCVALPSEKEELINNNKDSESNRGNIMDRFLDTLDKRHQVNEAAKMVAACLSTQQGEKEFSEILVHALLREDRSFHTIQMLEAAFRQKTELQRLQVLEDIKPISHILIAAARYLAAHTPSARAQGQTFEIAWRLHQGGKLYEEIG